MPDTNSYTRGQLWAQALASGRRLQREVDPLLTTHSCGRYIARFAEIGSTNAVAMAWATEGAREGSVVLAEHQTRGRGRMGRIWEDQAGRNLMFTLILRPRLRVEHLGLIMLAASVAVADTVASLLSQAVVRIKWPNDVFLNGRKCCGMLMESTSGGRGNDRAEAAVVGIGLNVNQDAFPDSFADRSTSLALEAGQLFDRAPLLAGILNRFERHYDGAQESEGEALRRTYLDRMLGLNEWVEVFAAGSGAAVSGIIRGIANTGALVLETKEGMRTIASGEVSTRQPGVN